MRGRFVYVAQNRLRHLYAGTECGSWASVFLQGTVPTSFPTTAFVLSNRKIVNYKGGFVRLVDGQSEAEKIVMSKDAMKGEA